MLSFMFEYSPNSVVIRVNPILSIVEAIVSRRGIQVILNAVIASIT